MCMAMEEMLGFRRKGLSHLHHGLHPKAAESSFGIIASIASQTHAKGLSITPIMEEPLKCYFLKFVCLGFGVPFSSLSMLYSPAHIQGFATGQKKLNRWRGWIVKDFYCQKDSESLFSR